MKQVLLLTLLLSSYFITRAQVHNLPAGKYETTVKGISIKWDLGDIVILDETRYKVSSTNEVGEYKFSATAQRVFFTSGPLKSVFAKTMSNGGKPVIVIPASENEQQGTKLASADIWGSYKQ
jgi:hypothetical protein